MTTVEQVVAGFVAFMIWRDLGVLERKARTISDQIVELKIILDQVKNAIGDNAFEAMLNKPITQTGSWHDIQRQRMQAIIDAKIAEETK